VNSLCKHLIRPFCAKLHGTTLRETNQVVASDSYTLPGHQRDYPSGFMRRTDDCLGIPGYNSQSPGVMAAVAVEVGREQGAGEAEDDNKDQGFAGHGEHSCQKHHDQLMAGRISQSLTWRMTSGSVMTRQ
jgi:hypothetical protein